MMQLQEAITFEDGRIESSTLNPAENGASCVLLLSVRLTAEAADSLGKKEQFFNKKGISFEFDSSVKLGESMVDVELRIPPSRGMRLAPSKIVKFAVSHESQGDDSESTLRLEFKCHFKGDEVVKEVAAWVILQNKKEFRLKLDPKQGALFEEGADKKTDSDDSDAEAESSGTLASKAKMSGANLGLLDEGEE